MAHPLYEKNPEKYNYLGELRRKCQGCGRPVVEKGSSNPYAYCAFADCAEHHQRQDEDNRG